MTAKRVYTAKVLLVNEDNEVLVLWSGEWPDRPDRSGKPDFPGGIVEQGETFWDGVARETYEEVGIRLNPEEFTLLYTETKFHDVTQDVVSKSMFVAQVTRPTITLSWEHKTSKWMPYEEVLSLEWRPFHKDALAFIAEHKMLRDFER